MAQQGQTETVTLRTAQGDVDVVVPTGMSDLAIKAKLSARHPELMQRGEPVPKSGVLDRPAMPGVASRYAGPQSKALTEKMRASRDIPMDVAKVAGPGAATAVAPEMLLPGAVASMVGRGAGALSGGAYGGRLAREAGLPRWSGQAIGGAAGFMSPEILSKLGGPLISRIATMLGKSAPEAAGAAEEATLAEKVMQGGTSSRGAGVSPGASATPEATMQVGRAKAISKPEVTPLTQSPHYADIQAARANALEDAKNAAMNRPGWTAKLPARMPTSSAAPGAPSATVSTGGTLASKVAGAGRVGSAGDLATWQPEDLWQGYMKNKGTPLGESLGSEIKRRGLATSAASDVRPVGGPAASPTYTTDSLGVRWASHPSSPNPVSIPSSVPAEQADAYAMQKLGEQAKLAAKIKGGT
jgi:hypothetical protein